MPNNPLVFNETRNCRLSLKQAKKAIANCSATWTDYGKSIRELTYAESVTMKLQEQKVKEPLPYSEVRGVKFQPPIGAQAAYIEECKLAFEANKFAVETVQ